MNIPQLENHSRMEENFRNLVMQAPVSMVLLRGEDFILELANENTLQSLGMDWDIVKNRPLFDIFPELVEQEYDAILSQVYSTGQPFKANQMPINLDRYGFLETRYLNFTIQVIKDSSGISTGLLGVGVDVSEQVKAHIKILESESKYRGLFQSMSQGFCIVEMLYNDHNQPFDYTFLEVNPAFETLTGLIDAQGKRVSEVIPGHENHWYEIYGKVASTGEKQTFIEHSSVLNKTFEVHAYRIGGNHSRKVAMLFTDISERKKLEDAQLQFANELRNQVAIRTKELQRSNEDLHQFAHVASHDLKEPVRKIKTFATMLQSDVKKLPVESQEYLFKIQKATDRLKDMIDGVLSYSESDNAQVIDKINLNEIIESILTDLEILIQNKQTTFTIASLPVIEGSKLLIYQLFYNLISNALKFTKPDIPGKIDITSSIIQKGGTKCAEITITDNGIGFEQSFAKKIFETFVRLHSKDNYEGTGLGLALCKKIVQRHSGRIIAKGKLNEGASFTVMLPIKHITNN